MEVPTLHQVLRCGHSAAAYQAGTMTTKCCFFFKLCWGFGPFPEGYSHHDCKSVLCGSGHVVAGHLYVTDGGVEVLEVGRQSSLVHCRAERSQQRYLGLAALLPLMRAASGGCGRGRGCPGTCSSMHPALCAACPWGAKSSRAKCKIQLGK